MGLISIAFKATVFYQLYINVVAQYPMPYGGQPMQMGQQMPQMAQMPQGYPPPQMPMPMPMPVAMSQPRLPVVVMPFRNKDTDKMQKKKKHRRHNKKKKHKSKKQSSSSSSDSSGTDSSDTEDYEVKPSRRKGGRKSRRHQVLTPVISYVTKDGYVVYQKKIRKDKAKDWLELGRKEMFSPSESSRERMISTSEEILLQKYKARKRNNNNNNL